MVRQRCICVALAAILLLVGATARAQIVPPGVDVDTVALWPFDEFTYTGMALTDAGPHTYDLRLRPAGRLSTGRFGNALEITSSSLPACMYAEWFGLQDSVVAPDRPNDPPTEILATLAGSEWTWEAWVRLRQSPAAEATLLHLKNGTQNQFYCAFSAQANAVIIRDELAGAQRRVPLLAPLAAGGWHHVAIVKQTRKNSVRHMELYGQAPRAASGAALVASGPMPDVAPPIVDYVVYIDGVAQSPAQTIAATETGIGSVVEWNAGLIGIMYGDPEFVRPASPHHVHQLNYYWGAAGGSGWSAFWRGSITIPRELPAGERIRVRADALWGVRLRVNGQEILSGWSPTGPRAAYIIQPAGARVSFVCELNQRDASDARIRLYWSWPGHDEELIPASAFSYSTLDERTIQAELDGGVEPNNGLVGVYYGNTNWTNPGAIEIVQQLNQAWGLTRGGGWSETFSGSIRSYTNQVITLRADCLWGMRLTIGNQLRIDGMNPAGARSTTFTLTSGARTTFTLQYSQQASSDARLKLYWSWPGKAEELVPVGALAYSELDRRRAQAIFDPNMIVVNPPRLFEMRVGTADNGTKPLNGWVDELRFSKRARYSSGFTPPSSFTYAYGNVTRPTNVANGPPLLFGSAAPSEPLAMGGRRHLFLDSRLLATSQSLSIVANPWLRREKTNYATGGDPGVYQDGGVITLFNTNADMWNGGITAAKHAAMYLMRSTNGLTFSSPVLNQVELDGTSANNVFLRAPVQGQIFIDDNPACPPAQRFKYTAFYMSRGLYLYTSPDGLHWTRGETVMTPIDCGGGVESFWDDQRGEYVSYVRHEGFLVKRGSTGRASGITTSSRPWEAWSFNPVPNPFLRLPLALPVMTEEMPIPFQPFGRGELYRVRALKYAWASDAYFAFTWREVPVTREFVGDLGYSRDGLTWSYVGPPYSMGIGDTVGGGATITRVVPLMGLIRRGYELWCYANVGTTLPAESGVYRYTQRLDGFFSLDAGASTGTATSRALTFTGNRLQVNVNAAGGLRVGVVHADGSPIAGYGLANCTPVVGDFGETYVKWGGSESIASLAGTPVRLVFELTNAKLYAFQFTP